MDMENEIKSEFRIIREEAKRQYDKFTHGEANAISWHFWKFAFHAGYYFSHIQQQPQLPPSNEKI